MKRLWTVADRESLDAAMPFVCQFLEVLRDQYAEAVEETLESVEMSGDCFNDAVCTLERLCGYTRGIDVPPTAGEFLVRDESGRGGSVTVSGAEVVRRFAEDWENAMDGEESFADVVDGLEVGGEMRIDGATVIVRVS